jgi:hypothetical protein
LAAEQPPAAARAPTVNGRNGMHHQVMRMGKRVGIAIAGGVVIILGLVLSVPLVPGPGVLVILLGLGILSLEFERPRVWLAHLKARAVDLKHRIDARRSQRRDG